MTSFGTFLLTMVLLVVVGIPALARKRALVHLTVVTVLLLTSLALFFDAGSGMVETLGRDPTLTGRTELWDELLAMNTSPAVGTGFESFWMGDRLDTIWRMHWWHPNEAHNGYIEVFLNLGWLGVFLLALIAITGYARVIATLKDEPDVAGLRLTYLVAALLYSGSEAGFRLLTPVWICFILGAFAVPKIKQTATAPARDQLPASPAATARVRGVELVYPRRPRPVPAHFRGTQRGH
jgi:O-antigen ligase